MSDEEQPPPAKPNRANLFGSNRKSDTPSAKTTVTTPNAERTASSDFETRKISTFSVRMTSSELPVGHDMKRFLAIIMPRHKSIKVHPHTMDLSDTLEDFDLFPVGEESKKYIFDIKRKSYGKRVEVEMSINIESEIQLNQIKFEPHVFKLLQDYGMYVNARKTAPAVTTKAIGCLWNLDPKRTSRHHLMEELEFLMPDALKGTYMYLTQHRYKWKTGTTVNIADMYKVMVDVAYADAVGIAIKNGLLQDDPSAPTHEDDCWYALRDSCLFP